MKVRELTFAVCAGLLVAGAAAAQDAKPADKKPAERVMSAEEKAMMEAWAKYATPARATGRWPAWSAPGTPR